MNYKVFAFVIFTLFVLLPCEIYGQTTTSDEQAVSVFFKEVHVDKNPVPNKPFKISTIISTNNPYDLIVSISVPNEISVTSQPIANLEWGKLGQEREAEWTVISSKPGSYPIEIIARVSEPPQTVKFSLNVSIGSQGSLQIQDIQIPGSLFPNTVFPISLTLKNTNLIDDDNIMVNISVPPGLQLLDNAVLRRDHLNSLNETTFTWNIKAETPGSFPIIFDYSSTNSGDNSRTTNINVGTKFVADLKITDITMAGTNSLYSNVGSGDTDVPLEIKLLNNGNVPVYDIAAAVVLDTPFAGDGISSDKLHELGFEVPIFSDIQYKIVQINRLAVDEETTLKFLINTKENLPSGLHEGKLIVLFYDEENKNQKSFNLPFSISSGAMVDIHALESVVLPNVVSPVNLEISNVGNKVIQNMKIVNVISNVYTSLDTPVNVGQIGIGESKSAVLNILLSNQTLSYLPLPISLSYSTDGVERFETFQVSIREQGTPEFRLSKISTEPTSLYAGEKENRIDVEITNIGFSAYDINAKVILPDGFKSSWSDSDSYYLSRLLSQEAVQGSFYVDIDESVEPKNYPISIDIVTGNYSQRLDLNLLVSSKAKFELIDVDDSRLYPGAVNVQAQVTLKNIGTEIAETTTTKLVGGNTIPGVRSSGITSVGNEEDLGSILPGQVFVTTFLVNLDKTHPVGKQSATMEVRWTQDDDPFLQTIIIPYSVSAGPPYLLYVEGIPMTYVILAILLVIGGFFFNQRRKRRLKIIESELVNSMSMDSDKFGLSKIEPIVYNLKPLADDTKENIDESFNSETEEKSDHKKHKSKQKDD